MLTGCSGWICRATSEKQADRLIPAPSGRGDDEANRTQAAAWPCTRLAELKAPRSVEWLADAVRPVQSGDVNLYLLYVLAVILLAYLLGAV